MSNLTVMKKADAKLDFLSLGALVVRLDPGIVPFEYAHSLDLHVSGGEFNVSANLSRAFGQRTAVASAMVDYPIGAKIESEVRRMGVQAFYKRFAHDGVRGPNMAHVYSDRGQGLRAPVVFYNRSNESSVLLNDQSFDWDAIFAGGIRWFHSGGIFSALLPASFTDHQGDGESKSPGRSSPSTSTTGRNSGSRLQTPLQSSSRSPTGALRHRGTCRCLDRQRGGFADGTGAQGS